MKLGLVLSGGGAKGAHQAGVFRAMDELGLRQQIYAVSGCSIGAINALLLAGSDPERWMEVWQRMRYEDLVLRDSAAVGMSESSLTQKIAELVAGLKNKGLEITNLSQFLSQSSLEPFSADGMRRMLRQYVDFARLTKAPPYLWVCAYNLEREQPEYFSLLGRSEAEIIELTLASASLPMIVPPIVFDGCHYCDGGVTPPYVHAKNADKIPVAALRGAGCQLVVVLYLSHYDKVDLSGFPEGTKFLELYPSSPLEMVRGSGTLNLSRESINEHILMGYQDGMAAFAPLLLELAKGGNGDGALARHAEYNRCLLEGKLPLLRRAEEALRAHV
ncbi:MAG: patatin-like phospholipase family protein [Angelakisella sp.]